MMTDADRDEMLVAIFNLLGALAERITGDEALVCIQKNRWATDKKPTTTHVYPHLASVNWIPLVAVEGQSDGKRVRAPMRCDRSHGRSASLEELEQYFQRTATHRPE